MDGEELVRELYDASYRRLVEQLTAVTGSGTEAEELVQGAFARALLHPRSITRTDDPEAWVHAVAVDEARSRRRPPIGRVARVPSVVDVEPPAFEQIAGRARRLRRRHVVVAAVATAAVVGAVLTGTVVEQGGGHPAPGPVPALRSRGTTATPVAVDAAKVVLTGRLVSLAAGQRGSLLTVWRSCPEEGDDASCRAAWQLQGPSGTHQGLIGGSVPTAQAVGHRFVVTSWDRQGLVIDPSGRARPLTTATTGQVKAGDVLVHRRKTLAVVDPDSATVWPLRAVQGAEGWAQGALSSDGTVWAMPSVPGGARVCWSTDGITWQHHVMPSDDGEPGLPGYLAVSGDHVAALSGHDGATVLPVADLAVTSDAGRTWTDLHRAALPFSYVDAMAATSGGTLYVVTPGGEHLYRSADDSWTRFVEVSNPSHADRLESAGARVIAWGGAAGEPMLLGLDDEGRAEQLPLLR